MRVIIIFFVFTLIYPNIVHGQTPILKNINFDKDNWRLFGFAYAGANSLSDSLGDFFINDKIILKQMQKAWKLNKYGGQCSCVGDYELHFMNDKGNSIDWDLNFENGLIIVGGQYSLPDSLFRKFMNRFKRLTKTAHTVANLDTARKLFAKLKSLDTIYCNAQESNNWEKYSGVLEIHVIDSTTDFLKMDKIVLKNIKKDFPSEVFSLDMASEQPNSYYDYDICCSEAMGTTFKTYQIKNKWHPFSSITFEVYGLTENEIKEIIAKL